MSYIWYLHSSSPKLLFYLLYFLRLLCQRNTTDIFATAHTLFFYGIWIVTIIINLFMYLFRKMEILVVTYISCIKLTCYVSLDKVNSCASIMCDVHKTI